MTGAEIALQLKFYYSILKGIRPRHVNFVMTIKASKGLRFLSAVDL